MNKLEISRDVAKEVIPCLQTRLEEAEGRALAAEDEAKRIRTALAELNAKLKGEELPFSGKPRQRLPKGHGAETIVELFASLPDDAGLTMSQIRQRTGINHSTIYRTLTDPKRNKGRFVQDGEVWRLKGK